MGTKYLRSRGNRINCSSVKEKGKKRVPLFWSVSVISPGNYWWSESEKKWVKIGLEEFRERNKGFTSYKSGIHSVKAAQAHLRRHTELPKGTVIALFSIYDKPVYITKR